MKHDPPKPPSTPQTLTLSALRPSLCAAARGKRRRGGVARFLLREDAELAALLRELQSGRYQPGPGRSFWIEDPKLRCIFALPFRDRVVQHLLIQVTQAALERRLRPQTYACRPGFGTHRCLQRAAAWFRCHSYVLHIDIRKFFPSIDHAILRLLLQRSTPPPWRWLRDRFLDAPVVVERADFHFPGDDLLTPLLRPHGLPVGSLTSQLWANSYLSPIDDLLACELGIRSFVRYSDDLLIFDDDPGRLSAALGRIAERATELRLRLHPIKTRLHRTRDPVRFLGFVLRRTDNDGVCVRLHRENLTRMRRRTRELRALFAAGALAPEEIRGQLSAWLAHARHGHTRTLIERELSRLRFALAE